MDKSLDRANLIANSSGSDQMGYSLKKDEKTSSEEATRTSKNGHSTVEFGPNSFDNAETDKTTENIKKKLATRQLVVLINLMSVNLGSAMVVSLQAPFYPAEAERKGATATEYGFVFGIYELIALIVSPLFGKYMGVIGHKFLLNAGIFVTSISCMLFGTLHLVMKHNDFISLSFVIRVFEAIGATAYATASFSICAHEFPQNVATAFSLLEMFFGLGLIGGPTLGGALYELGGFITPFLVLGGFLFVAAIVTFIMLPPLDENHDDDNMVGSVSMLKLFPVALSGAAIVCSALSIGFIVTTLEPHIRQFGLSPFWTGAVMVCSGGIYAITAGFWGKIIDSTGLIEVCCGVGSFSICVCYLFLGPAPFIPLEPKLWLCILGLLFHGFGVGGQLVSAFTGSLQAAVRNGYPNSLSTYSVISALFTSSFALGAFVGPSLAGYLFDQIGFSKGSMVIFGVHALMGIVNFVYFGVKIHNRGRISSNLEIGTREEKSPLIPNTKSKDISSL